MRYSEVLFPRSCSGCSGESKVYTEDVTGSNPVSPTIQALVSAGFGNFRAKCARGSVNLSRRFRVPQKVRNIRVYLTRLFCPPGFRIVPYRPNARMLRAAGAAMSPGKRPTLRWVSNKQKHKIRYQAMLDAAGDFS